MSSNAPGGAQMRYSTGPPSQNPSGLSNSPANRRPGGGSAGGGYLSAAAPPGGGAAMSQQRGGGASGSGGIPPRKKRRFADKLIPQQVRELVPESQAYMDLLAFEQKLDSTITRKKLDIQEALKRPIKVKRRLRIYVSHTFIAGKEPEKEGDEGQVPMWELRVEGRLLDDLLPPTTAIQPAATTTSGPVQSNSSATAPTANAPASAAAPAAGTAPPPSTASTTPARPIPKRKFSSFFKSLVIELDKDIYGPDNHLVEWHRTPQTNETDGFQVKRPGDRNVKCTILLLLDYQPMKFKLNPRLAKVLGMAAETRPKIIEALWQYIKTHKLQDAVDRDQVNCDSYLEQVFGCRRMRFMEIPQRLQGLLHQPDPIVINHMITYVEGNEKATACYDIDVEIEDPLKQQMAAFVHSQQSLNEIASLDQKIFDIVEQINEWKTRRDFFLRFSDNPKEFIQKWLISQSKDLKSMTEVVGEAESERRAEYYHQPQMQEGVFRYIYGKVQQKRAELEASLGVRQN